MSSYSNYYSAPDVSVFVISPFGNNEEVLLDRVSSLGWTERVNNIPIYGIGDRKYKFTAKGNCIVEGFLELNFVDEKYLLNALKSIRGDFKNAEEIKDQLARNWSTSSAEKVQLEQKLAAEQEKIDQASTTSEFPTNFDIKIILNNGFLFQQDRNKIFIIKDVKISGDSFTCGATDGGNKPITITYPFVGREVII